MSTPFDHERGEQPFDFRPQLRSALEHAAPYRAEDPLASAENASRYREEPDDYVICLDYEPGENEVYTSDASQYRALLAQATEILDGSADLTDEDYAWFEAAAQHEIDHHEAAEPFGTRDTISYYGVAFVTDEDGDPAFWPCHLMTGPLKKIHRAWSAMAPEDRSKTDVAIVRDLGYTETPYELRERALAEPPLAEDWGIAYREALVRALVQTIHAAAKDPEG